MALRFLSSILFCMLVFFSCNTTTTKAKDPVFAGDISALEAMLTDTVPAESWNLGGAEITTNGKSTSELEISIINPVSVPEDTTAMKDLSRFIASSVRQYLSDKNQYDKYSVLFITQSEKGSVKKRSWTGNVFRADELQ